MATVLLKSSHMIYCTERHVPYANLQMEGHLNMTLERYGIIDIGSNSIRLVIYEKTETGAYRVIDGNKRAARLSNKINDQGELTEAGIQELIETINIFNIQMNHHHITNKVAVATAAIRNAANTTQIVQAVAAATGLHIRVFSGEEEAEHGFIGMINSLPIESGFLIDIGGGSTEITLFKNRKIIANHSFPIGCVSLNKKFDSKNGLSPQDYERLAHDLIQQFNKFSWMKSNAHLPLVCLGGTARAFAKIHQAEINYPYQQTHHYMINALEAEKLFHSLSVLPYEDRKKRAGLTKDRVDVIIPGLAILTTTFKYLQNTHYIICGAGLRDGIFLKLLFPQQPILDNPIQYSVNNLISLYNVIPKAHIQQVNEFALHLFDTLQATLGLNEGHRKLLDIASQLYRIGGAIEYYDYNAHTFYVIAHSRLHGLTHSEILSIAAIAAFKSKSKLKSQLKPYSLLISETELVPLHQLGLLLQVSISLDRTETQGIQKYELRLKQNHLHIDIKQAKHQLLIEQSHLDFIQSDCKKTLGVKMKINVN